MDMSKREKFKSRNSLVCLLQGLTGKTTTVELRNESSMTGCIEIVDGFMNITMKDVHFTDPYGNKNFFEQFFVNGKNIRYVQIPERMNILQVMSMELPKVKVVQN